MITAADDGDQGVISTVQVDFTQFPARPTFTAVDPVGIKVSPGDGVQTVDWSVSQDLRMQPATGRAAVADRHHRAAMDRVALEGGELPGAGRPEQGQPLPPGFTKP